MSSQLFHSLYHFEMAYLSATAEVMLLHVDARPRAAPMPQERYEYIKAVAAAHATALRPTQAGRGIVQLGRPATFTLPSGKQAPPPLVELAPALGD